MTTEKTAWAALATNNRREFLRGLSRRLVVVTNKISFIGHEYSAKDVAAALDAQTKSKAGTNSVKRRFLDEQGPKYKALQSQVVFRNHLTLFIGWRRPRANRRIRFVVG